MPNGPITRFWPGGVGRYGSASPCGTPPSNAAESKRSDFRSLGGGCPGQQQRRRHLAGRRAVGSPPGGGRERTGRQNRRPRDAGPVAPVRFAKGLNRLVATLTPESPLGMPRVFLGLAAP